MKILKKQIKIIIITISLLIIIGITIIIAITIVYNKL